MDLERKCGEMVPPGGRWKGQQCSNSPFFFPNRNFLRRNYAYKLHLALCWQEEARSLPGTALRRHSSLSTSLLVSQGLLSTFRNPKAVRERRWNSEKKSCFKWAIQGNGVSSVLLLGSSLQTGTFVTGCDLNHHQCRNSQWVTQDLVPGPPLPLPTRSRATLQPPRVSKKKKMGVTVPGLLTLLELTLKTTTMTVSWVLGLGVHIFFKIFLYFNIYTILHLKYIF